MKIKIFGLLAVLLMFSNVLSAQGSVSVTFDPAQGYESVDLGSSTSEYQRHEFSLGYGWAPLLSWAIHTAAKTKPVNVEKNRRYVPGNRIDAINFDYCLYYKWKAAVDFNLCYYNYAYSSYALDTEEFVENWKGDFFSLMIGIKEDWIRQEHFSLYSRFGLGAMYIIQKKTDKDNVTTTIPEFFPTFHASLIGVEAGSENFRGFVEFGIGHNGFVTVGVKYIP